MHCHFLNALATEYVAIMHEAARLSCTVCTHEHGSSAGIAVREDSNKDQSAMMHSNFLNALDTRSAAIMLEGVRPALHCLHP